jgi:hypothetical protein
VALIGKLKAAAGITVAAVGFHAYQAGVVPALAHHGGSAESVAAVPAGLAGTPGSNEALANQMAASLYGWRGGQRTCLDDLWIHESGFRSDAVNSSSGATGIPQLLPSVHQVPANWSNPRIQVKWGLAYIHGKYGTPCGAWSFEMSHTPNWY